jgi:hypothetical protein
MSHRATKRFWACYAELPNPIRLTANKCFAILKDNPGHSSLNFKKIGKVWSVRIGTAYRALAVSDGKDYIWVWIGKHDAYERIIRGF